MSEQKNLRDGRVGSSVVAQNCECGALWLGPYACTKTVNIDMERLRRVRKDPGAILVSKTCKFPPKGKVIDEGTDFYVYL